MTQILPALDPQRAPHAPLSQRAPDPQVFHGGGPHLGAFLYCLAAAAGFVIVAILAVGGKSATFDEPVYVASGYSYLARDDFRVNPEHPPLWKMWAALPNALAGMSADFTSPSWARMPHDPDEQFAWSNETLFHDPANDAVQIVARSRLMMLVLAALMVALLWRWAWLLAGPVAAAIVMTLFCLDPNFLAHAPLVVNDVAAAAALLGLMYRVWLMGRCITAGRVTLAAVLAALAVSIKSTGIIFVAVASVSLLRRAFMAQPWPAGRGALRSRWQRVGAALSISAVMGVSAFGGIWGSYGFRFLPTPDSQLEIDGSALEFRTRLVDLRVAHPDRPATDAEVRAWRPGFLWSATQIAQDMKLLPQAYISGLRFTYVNTRLNISFLCGDYSETGWWYYFPAAVLFKTPTATLGAMLAALVAAIALRTRVDAWTATCLGFPPLAYFVIAMFSNMDIGIRHVLPVYPFLFLQIGIAGALAVVRWKRFAQVVCLILGTGLLGETLAAFPNYIAFFNTPATSLGKLTLLGDSNVDWGQDLPLLKHWQDEHPGTTLLLSYFGTADPEYYGLEYIDISNGQIPAAQQPAVIAISANNLLGLYDHRTLRAYPFLRTQKPIQSLGDSIYLFDYLPGSR